MWSDEPASYEGPAPSPVCGNMPACKYPPHPVGTSHSWQDFPPGVLTARQDGYEDGQAQTGLPVGSGREDSNEP